MDLRRGRRRFRGKSESHLHALSRRTAEDGRAQGCLAAATRTEPHLSCRRFLERCNRGISAWNGRHRQRRERVAAALGGEGAGPGDNGPAVSSAGGGREMGKLRSGGGWQRQNDRDLEA